jgi:hypothetical protein
MSWRLFRCEVMVIELLEKRASRRIKSERVCVGSTIPVGYVDWVGLWDHGVVWAMLCKDVADRVDI